MNYPFLPLKKISVALSGMVLLLAGAITAQSQIISGTVRSAENNEPLAGVTVRVSNGSPGTATDPHGHYKITGVSPYDTLVFSYTGYGNKTQVIGKRRQIDVVLTPVASSLNQVVIIGYGTQKKSSVTNSISIVQNKNLDQIPVGRMETALIGKLSGVNISTLQSTPGTPPVVTVRGMGSISGGNDPLIVIDGVPGGNLGQIDMNDVESVEVLKDASAAAIYGSRGSAGVILITTKSGTPGKTKFNLGAYYGFTQPIVHHDWLTGQQWYNYLVKYENREFVWAGGDPSIPMYGDPRRPVAYQINPVVDSLPQTIWQNEATQVAPIQNYNLSLSGGTKKVDYYISGDYSGEQGAIRTAFYNTYSFRANVHVKINNAIDFGIQENPFYSQQRVAGSNIVNLAKFPPFVSPDKVDGKYLRTTAYVSSGFSAQANPLTYLYGTHDYNNSFTNFAHTYLNVKIVKGLSFKTSLGSIINYTTSNDYVGGDGDPLVTETGQVGDVQDYNLVNENVLSYANTFKKVHEVSAIMGASYQLDKSQNTLMAAVPNSFSNDIVETLNDAVINPSASSSSKSQWGLISYFGRVNYAYKMKYFITGSIRSDGSSRFGSANKWGYFPSVSAGWRISQEPFFQNISFLNELKLRASYGVTGNFNIGDFQYLGAVGNVVYSPGEQTVDGIAQTSIENPTLSWEKAKGYDIGLDFGVFNNRITFSADYYNRLTDGMLYSVNIPAITGFESTIENIGSVRNKGIDLEIRTYNLTGALKWNTSFELSHNKNEVVDLGGVDERINTNWSMDWLLKKGVPMFSYYGYKMIGVFQNQQQIDNTPHLAGTKPGNPIVKDVNGDGIIDDNDRVVLGNAQPTYVLGMTNSVSYKNFDLSITLQASLGAKIFNGENENYQGTVNGALRKSLVENEWWSESDPGDGKTPAASLSQLFGYNTNTDYYIENASYLNVRNVNLGYNFSEVARHIHLNDLRAYISVSNLLIIKNKNNHAYNPEGTTGGGITGINSIPGFNDGSEPLNRAIVLGLNIGF